VLEVRDQPHARGQGGHHVLEGRDALTLEAWREPAADIQRAQVGQIDLPDRRVNARRARQAVVVVDDRVAVAARQHVHLDSVGTLAHGRAQRGQGILGRHPAAASVGHHERPRHYFTPDVSAVGDR